MKKKISVILVGEYDSVSRILNIPLPDHDQKIKISFPELKFKKEK